MFWPLDSPSGLVPMSTQWQLSLESVAAEASITDAQARIAARAVLRGLHRTVVVDPDRLVGAVREAYMCFGGEACYHLVSLLEHQRAEHDPGLPWSEMVLRFSPEIMVFGSVVAKWRPGGPSDGTAPSGDLDSP
jgi:hypothetical protein